MPAVAIVIGTFALWITAKGELGKYLQLATTPLNKTTSAPVPAATVNANNPVSMGTGGASTNTSQGSLYVPQMLP